MRTPMLLAVTLTLATGCASSAPIRSGHDAERGGAARDVAGWFSALAADASDVVADGAQSAAEVAAETSGELAAGASDASVAAADAAAEVSAAGARSVEAAAAGVATASRDAAAAVGGTVERAEAEAPRLELVVESCSGGPGC